MKTSTELDSSLERLVPDSIEKDDITGTQTLNLHIERYQWAINQLLGLPQIFDVLDLACGVGYGSHMLASDVANSRVVGIDISKDAVEFAKNRYKSSNLSFLVADAIQLKLDHKVDAIVSFETIEHVEKCEQLIENFGNLLRMNGALIASVPITPSVDINPHHLHDFTEKTFKKLMIMNGFEIIGEFKQVQDYNPLRMLMRREKRLSDMRKGLISYYVENPMACFSRLWATLKFGFNNIYLTLHCRKIR